MRSSFPSRRSLFSTSHISRSVFSCASMFISRSYNRHIATSLARLLLINFPLGFSFYLLSKRFLNQEPMTWRTLGKRRCTLPRRKAREEGASEKADGQKQDAQNKPGPSADHRANIFLHKFPKTIVHAALPLDDLHLLKLAVLKFPRGRPLRQNTCRHTLLSRRRFS